MITSTKWHYANDETMSWEGPYTLEELDGLHQSGKVEDHTRVISQEIAALEGPQAQGIYYSEINRSPIEFDPQPEELLNSRKGKEVTVLTGPNNCGKTLLLKQLYSLIGQEGYLISCNRFSHVDVLNTRNINELEYRNNFDNFIREFVSSNQNSENNNFRLDQILVTLKDAQREKLFNLCERLLGNKFSLQRIDPENTFSSFYVDMDGENLKYGSSGTRLLLTLLGTMLNERIRTLLIDEPEIGLSPRIQSILSEILYNPTIRSDFCPHLEQVFIATHSHIFLDKETISNNFSIRKDGPLITSTPTKSISDLHSIQFSMLGNELEQLFMPSAILIVEGESDVVFLTKVFQTAMPTKRITAVRGGGDGEIPKALNFIKDAFGELQQSPYRTRIFVILDKTHSAKIDKLSNQGIPKENIIEWSKNGIEYLYPTKILAKIFRCTEDEVKNIELENNTIEFQGITLTKRSLADKVVDLLETEDCNHPELDALIKKVTEVC